jgi:hypothetical protein
MNIKEEFRNFLNESPVAILGDWNGFKSKDLRIGKKGIELDWTLKDKIKDKEGHILEIYCCENKYILGSWGIEDNEREKPVFVVMVQLQILKRTDLKQMNFSNPIQMSKVETSKGFKDRGLAKLLYSWFIFNNYTLISDMVQFDGARKLYDSLSRENNIIADIIDDQNKNVLKHNVRVDSGLEDWDFDNEIWDYSFDKSHIRIALYRK